MWNEVKVRVCLWTSSWTCRSSTRWGTNFVMEMELFLLAEWKSIGLWRDEILIVQYVSPCLCLSSRTAAVHWGRKWSCQKTIAFWQMSSNRSHRENLVHSPSSAPHVSPPTFTIRHLKEKNKCPLAFLTVQTKCVPKPWYSALIKLLDVFEELTEVLLFLTGGWAAFSLRWSKEWLPFLAWRTFRTSWSGYSWWVTDANWVLQCWHNPNEQLLSAHLPAICNTKKQVRGFYSHSGRALVFFLIDAERWT